MDEEEVLQVKGEGGEGEGLFRVTDLKQWVYCPRILFYAWCLPEVRPVTFKMEAGTEAGLGEEGREARRSLRAYGVAQGTRAFGVALSSVSWGLRGTVDMAIWPEGGAAEIIPVDYKLSKVAGPHFKLQLAAYALLLEEAYGLPVRRGFLYFMPLRKAEAVPMNAGLRAKVQAALAAMRTVVATEQMPAPTPVLARCVACEFRRFCNDV
jgi:CRISPR-associated exonuclease Cas4